MSEKLTQYQKRKIEYEELTKKRIERFEVIKKMSKEEILVCSFDDLFFSSARCWGVVNKALRNKKDYDCFDEIPIRDVTELTFNDVVFTQNCGKKTVQEIRQTLAEIGLSLKDDNYPLPLSSQLKVDRLFAKFKALSNDEQNRFLILASQEIK